MPSVRNTIARKASVGAAVRPTTAAAARAGAGSVSHNLQGQRLGPKGRLTRDRILAATVELLAGEDEQAISMSAIARRASLGITSLYNYFNDLTELLLALLEPLIDESEDAFVSMLRVRWPDDELGDHTRAFIQAYYQFWARNSRLLHLRNSLADGGDQRMLTHRLRTAEPIIPLMAAQMAGDAGYKHAAAHGMATVLLTGIERFVTMSTDRPLSEMFNHDMTGEADYLQSVARLVELAVRDGRGLA